MPWLSALADKNAIATNYYSDEAGSLRDYLWLSSGSGEHVFGCTGNDCPETITDNNIFRQLNTAGLSWKVYAESLPQAGFMGPSSGEYVKRHNPAPWYSDVKNANSEQLKMVPFSEFSNDLATNQLPAYSLIVPNLQHDAHDGTPAMADAWLKQNIGPLLASAYFQPGGDALLFITFDNGDGDAQGQVFTSIIGPKVVPGAKLSTHYRHENTLRTIMELFGLKSFPGASETAASISGFLK
jgi:phosphatidylinositol-3-phosphatase